MICKFDSWINVNGHLNVQPALTPGDEALCTIFKGVWLGPKTGLNAAEKRKILYDFFWVIPRRLNFICRYFGTLCLFHFHRRISIRL
jgi:hypothetical protein